jgi:Protein of unknown function (DUF664)
VRPSGGRPTDSTRPGLQARLGVSTLTLGGLLKHVAAVEDHTVATKLSGKPIGGPWETNGWDGSNDWEFASAADESPEELYALWDAAVQRSRARHDPGICRRAHRRGPAS